MSSTASCPPKPSSCDGHSPKTAMILAAGLGSRLKPLTDSMPKALVPYNGVPMIESLILRLKSFGFSRIVINVHHFADMLEDFVRSKDRFGLDIAFSDERDLLRDTGGGIRHAWRSGLLGYGPVLIHNVDIISDINLSLFYSKAAERTRHTAAALLVNDRASSRFLLADSKGMLRGWTCPAKGLFKGAGTADTPDRSALIPHAFSGIHLITPEAMRLMYEWPEQFSIIDFYLHIAATVSVRCICAPAGTYINDIGKLSQLH